jgi:adenine/guanine phosphoribosyltransferase-like PRPP-binding protein
MEYWQQFLPAATGEADAEMIDFYDAPMPDGSRLRLPLRDLGDIAVAGMIANQASFDVAGTIATWMTQSVTPLAPDIVVGLPTLGHVYAGAVAWALGHPNWVALGTTRKLWYDDELSVPLSSITSPQAGRRLWLDPRLLPRLQNRRVLLVDDVISTGASARAGIDLLAEVGITQLAVCVAMAQGNRWQAGWPADIPVIAAFATPLFARTNAGWSVLPETRAAACCTLAAADCR